MILFVLGRLLALAALIILVRWLVNTLSRNSGFSVRFFVALALSLVAGFGLAQVGIPLPICGASGAAVLALSLWGSKRRSAVRTAWLDVQLDKNGAVVNGRVLAGTFEGAELNELDEGNLDALARELAVDPESRRLLYDYMARRFGAADPISLEDARRRRALSDNRDNSAEIQGDQADNPPEDAPVDAMDHAQALEVLGLESGAEQAEILAAHARLNAMAQPENGGSAYLASQINAAKRVLVGE